MIPDNGKKMKLKESNGAIVVVAKCPIPGKSKTRLTPLLGIDGSASFAKAMLSDVLATLTCSKLDQICKILLYAPGNEEGYGHMKTLLDSLQLNEKTPTNTDGWLLLPMISESGCLLSSDLGSKLTDALQRARSIIVDDGPVVFLGMDSPELPLEEIVAGLRHETNEALMCPSADGGYGMLSVPSSAPLTIFCSVQWSHPLTALSQLKAITDLNVQVKLGRLMHDIDEPEDITLLAQRLCAKKNATIARTASTKEKGNADRTVLDRSSCTSLIEDTGECRYTWDSLVNIGLVKQNENNGGWVAMVE